MKYFTLEELTRTATGLKNQPDELQRNNLEELVSCVLDPLRHLFEKPIRVTSGFRSREVNKRVGGVGTSLHLKGMAADITCSDNRTIFFLLCDVFAFTQLIWERGDDRSPEWIHVSYDPGNLKCEVLKFDGKVYTKYD